MHRIHLCNQTNADVPLIHSKLLSCIEVGWLTSLSYCKGTVEEKLCWPSVNPRNRITKNKFIYICYNKAEIVPHSHIHPHKVQQIGCFVVIKVDLEWVFILVPWHRHTKTHKLCVMIGCLVLSVMWLYIPCSATFFPELSGYRSAKAMRHVNIQPFMFKPQ